MIICSRFNSLTEAALWVRFVGTLDSSHEKPALMVFLSLILMHSLPRIVIFINIHVSFLNRIL